MVIIEVLSDSTRDYDRTDNFKLYRDIPTLGHYVLIDQDSILVEYYRKQKSEWVFESYTRLTDTFTLTLDVGAIKLRLRDLYNRIEFDG